MAGADLIRTVAAAALARFDNVADWLGIGGGKNGNAVYALPHSEREHEDEGRVV